MMELFYFSIITLFSAVVFPIVFRSSWARQLALLLTGLASLVLAAFALQAILADITINVALYSITPMLQLSFLIDRLAAFFLLTIAIVALCVAIYSLSYAGHYGNAGNTLAGLMELMRQIRDGKRTARPGEAQR
ncbi:MAG: hypothetical protein HY519_02805 [Candidatus Aenigmarchaeota archaeon]|nr:hypothetical protein [Candidatus Aenigmarchaeota archaeon]